MVVEGAKRSGKENYFHSDAKNFQKFIRELLIFPVLPHSVFSEIWRQDVPDGMKLPR